MKKVIYSLLILSQLGLTGFLVYEVHKLREEQKWIKIQVERRKVQYDALIDLTKDHFSTCAWISKGEVDFGVWSENKKKASQYSAPLLYKK